MRTCHVPHFCLTCQLFTCNLILKMDQPNMADLFGKMADMQQQMAATQARLAEQTVTAEAGGGMVTVVANGTGQLVSVKIDPEAVDKADVEMLEDLVVAGVNKALEQAEALKASGMQQAAASMLPPGMDLGALGL